MARRSPHLDDPEAVRMAFQRVCMAGGNLRLDYSGQKGEFRLLMEDAGHLVIQMSDVVRGQWGIKPGAHVTLRVSDRGRPYESVVEFEGHGRFEGEEAAHLTVPRQLKATETHRLADYAPDKPLPCVYTTLAHDALQGLALAFGDEGLEVGSTEGGSMAGRLRMGVGSTVELRPEPAKAWVLPATVVYFGDGLAGLKWAKEADEGLLKQYRGWLMEMERAQMLKDREGFDPRGSAAPKQASAEESHRPLTRPHVWTDRDPLVLVLAAGEAFPKRAAESLGRKFGIASLDYLRGPMHPLIAELGSGLADWGRVKLILIHHSVRSGTAMEACRQLVQQEKCPLPILVAGTEEDAELKRNRTIAVGAVDYLVVEPFNVLKVMRAVEETLKLFG